MQVISFDFEYYKPTSISEAVQTYKSVNDKGQTVMYFNGGTEFITFARTNQVTADAVIDLKGIPECLVMEFQGNDLVIGAAVPLNRITESGLFPLLGETVRQVADHTSRNKITIGGNLFSRLFYREGVMPLLLTDCKVKVAGKDGEQILPLDEIVNQKSSLTEGQFLVQILVDKTFTNCPFIHFKKTRSSKVGYPLVSTAAMMKDDQIRAAFSGICEYPFRSIELENALNDSTLSIKDRIDKAVLHLPSAIVDDLYGSAKYRKFVLKNILQDTIEGLKGEIS